MFLKGKAALMIFILVAVTFTVYNIKEVNAQDQLCCEKTKSGEYCLYTEQVNCDSNFNVASATCEQTQFCKPACAVDKETGACYKSVALAKIRSNSNLSANSDETCNSVQECNLGCCKIGSQFRLTTEKECENEKRTKNMEEDVFDESITNEITCSNEAKKELKGCCIDDNGICKSTTREQCSTLAITNPNGSIGWFSNVFCSSNQLSCSACKARAKKGCIEGEDDVFYFDSCGNQEDVAEDCDYVEGTLCKQKGDNDAYCGSINCEKTADYKDKNKHDPRIGEFRKHGESWCIYESGTGGYLDRPGSRHFRHMCINGEELVEGCRDFREEICVQSNRTDYGYGTCLYNDIYDKKITQKISTVPQGFKFWENEGAYICAEGSTTCKVVYLRESRFSDWKCVENCQCETQKFIDDAAFYCKSKGDCGLDINILGKQGSSGLSIAWTGKIHGLTPSSVDPKQWSKSGVYGGMKSLSNALAQVVPDPKLPKTGYLESTINKGLLVTAIVGAIALMLVGAGIFALIPIVAAIFLVFLIGEQEIAVKTVNVNCGVWQAPIGSADCDKCDDDPMKDCSEYRCRSLGTTCELINEGTVEQACVDIDPRDVNSPLISPWEEALPKNYTLAVEQYGYSIKPIFEAYEKITFGIKTDEYAQCKIDNKHTKDYESMVNFLSESFKKEHNITMYLADGKEYVYYLRCMDKKGNKNIAEYAVRFATKKGPDRTPPLIEQTLIDNNAFIPYGIGNITIGISLNEPSYCKWSKEDKEYDLMENEFSCDTEVMNETVSFFNLYDCYANAENIEDGVENVFYFRCKDLSNNTNKQSYKYTLRGSRLFSINSIQPTGTIYEFSPTLKVITSGGAENGKSICRFSEADLQYEQMIEMFETNSNTHRQGFTNLTPGTYNYNIKCRDIAGNEASATNSFYVDIDISGPNLRNVWLDSAGLHIILDEESTCEYSNQQEINYGKGSKMSGVNTKEHVAPGLKNAVYYIACVDKSNNEMPLIRVYTKG